MSSIYYAEVNIICITVSIILLFSAARISDLYRKILFRWMLICNVVICFSDMMAGVLRGQLFTGARLLIYAFNISFFVASLGFSFCWVCYSMYLLFNKLIKPLFAVMGVFNLLVSLFFISAPLNGLTFTVNELNVYMRGPWIWLHWAVLFPSAIIPSVIAAFSNAERRKRRAVGLYAIIPAAATLAQALFYGLSLAQAGSTCALLMLYCLLQSDAINQAEFKADVYNEMSCTDAMTGIGNRRAFDKRIEEIKDREWVGVVFSDLNGLKVLNDKNGHKAGDALIIHYTQLLSESFKYNEIFRISGDEFVVISDDKSNFNSNFDKLTQSSKDFCSEGKSEGRGTDIISLIKNAEINMYSQKKKYYEAKGIERRIQ